MFAWFDTLGFDEVREAPFVQVVLADRPTVKESAGFLSNVHGETFDVVRLDLHREHHDNTVGRKERIITIPNEALGDFLRTYVPPLKPGPIPNPQSLPFQSSTEPFVLARAADAWHLQALSKQLFEAAKAPRAGPYQHASPTTRIRGELSDVVFNSLGQDLANPANARATLLTKVKSYRAHFVGGPHDVAAAELAATLEKMVKEDAAHRPPPASATEEQTIAELIYRLRDLAPHYVETLKGGLIVRRRDDTLTNLRSPAARLLQLGYKAVPALIDALPDGDLTRLPDFANGSSDVGRVGDVALFLLQVISCRQWIPENTHINSADTELQAAIRGWWSAAQSAGEEKTLVSQLQEGGDTSRLSADRLVEAYPITASASIVHAIDGTKEGGVRLALVTALSGLKNVQAVEAMKREVKILPDTASRFVAAKYLADSAPDEAFSAALDIYKRIRAGSEPGSSDLQQSAEVFLAASGRAEAVTAMSDGLAAAEPSVRFRTIVLFNVDPYTSAVAVAHMPLPKAPQEKQRYEHAVESLLAGELNDSRRYAGSALPTNGPGVGAPGGRGPGPMGAASPGAMVPTSRLCDCAAEVLSHRFPDRYRFVPGLSSTKMEVQRIDDINVWRKKTGEIPMEIPLSFR